MSIKDHKCKYHFHNFLKEFCAKRVKAVMWCKEMTTNANIFSQKNSAHRGLKLSCGVCDIYAESLAPCIIPCTSAWYPRALLVAAQVCNGARYWLLNGPWEQAQTGRRLPNGLLHIYQEITWYWNGKMVMMIALLMLEMLTALGCLLASQMDPSWLPGRCVLLSNLWYKPHLSRQ